MADLYATIEDGRIKFRDFRVDYNPEILGDFDLDDTDEILNFITGSSVTCSSSVDFPEEYGGTREQIARIFKSRSHS